MAGGRILMALAIGLALTTPASGASVGVADLAKRSPPRMILMMTPDVDVALITAGGLREPNQEWTDKARANLLKALGEAQERVGGTLTPFDEAKLTPEQAQLATDLVHLNNVVTFTAALHTVLPYAGKLPTKKDNFDWSLGPSTRTLGQAFGADHALFLIAYDSFSSGGRMAANLIGLLGCGIGVCVVPSGGRQDALAALVELDSGQIVWMSYIGKQSGDIREEAGAKKLIDDLIGTMPGVKPVEAPKARAK